jgi:hypothetical protein
VPAHIVMASAPQSSARDPRRRAWVHETRRYDAQAYKRRAPRGDDIFGGRGTSRNVSAEIRCFCLSSLGFEPLPEMLRKTPDKAIFGFRSCVLNFRLPRCFMVGVGTSRPLFWQHHK